jgi:hypothetical protein
MLVNFFSLSTGQQDDVKRLYNASFPDEERRAFDDLVTNAYNGEYELYAFVEGFVVEALVFLFTPKDMPYVLLDYFAVIPDKRGAGIGSRSFKVLVKKIQSSKRTLIMEVEDPSYGDDKTEKMRRIAFYLKNGADIIKEYDYVLPDLSGGIKSTKMKLMFSPTILYLDVDKLHTFITILFEKLYLRNQEDSILKMNLENLRKTFKN